MPGQRKIQTSPWGTPSSYRTSHRRCLRPRHPLPLPPLRLGCRRHRVRTHRLLAPRQLSRKVRYWSRCCRCQACFLSWHRRRHAHERALAWLLRAQWTQVPPPRPPEGCRCRRPLKWRPPSAFRKPACGATPALHSDPDAPTGGLAFGQRARLRQLLVRMAPKRPRAKRLHRRSHRSPRCKFSLSAKSAPLPSSGRLARTAEGWRPALDRWRRPSSPPHHGSLWPWPLLPWRGRWPKPAGNRWDRGPSAGRRRHSP
mmetsp:Transcript_119962/g.255987  ORF Transcript_119962/g.255987 Transcript_119962/m.255987 type:complete len:256 (-) Transcript_119962:25-792(-)